MTQALLVLAVALTVGAIVFGIIVLVSGDDGLGPAEPDGRAVPLPAERPLVEGDLAQVSFDTALRGYRMAQVDAALRRASYDIGYKDELIRVLQAEVDALREGRFPDAEVLRRAREAAAVPATGTGDTAGARDTGEARDIGEARDTGEAGDTGDAGVADDTGGAGDAPAPDGPSAGTSGGAADRDTGGGGTAGSDVAADADGSVSDAVSGHR